MVPVPLSYGDCSSTALNHVHYISPLHAVYTLAPAVVLHGRGSDTCASLFFSIRALTLLIYCIANVHCVQKKENPLQISHIPALIVLRLNILAGCCPKKFITK